MAAFLDKSSTPPVSLNIGSSGGGYNEDWVVVEIDAETIFMAILSTSDPIILQVSG